MLSKLAYLMLCRSIQLLVVLARGDACGCQLFGPRALLRCPDPGRAEAVASSGDQITNASSSAATATRRFAGSSTASS